MNQSELVSSIQALYPNALRNSGYTVSVDSSGNATIALWANSIGSQPTTAQLTAALATLQLTQAQTAQVAVIEAAFQVAAYETPVSYLGNTYWCDSQSQFMLLGAAFGYGLAGAVPSGFTWWSSTGVAVPFTLSQLQGLATTVLGAFQQNFSKRKALLAQIAAATSVTAVQAVVWA